MKQPGLEPGSLDPIPCLASSSPILPDPGPFRRQKSPARGNSEQPNKEDLNLQNFFAEAAAL